MPNQLLLTYSFPPLANAESIVTAKTVKALEGWGWKSTVCSVAPRWNSFQEDWGLLELLPPDVQAHRIAPLPVIKLPRLLRRLGLNYVALVLDSMPDNSIFWYPSALLPLRKILRGRSIGVIHSRAMPLAGHFLGLYAKQKTGLPWLVHLCAPWLDGPLYSSPGRLVTRWHARWERKIFAAADAMDRRAVTTPLAVALLRVVCAVFGRRRRRLRAGPSRGFCSPFATCNSEPNASPTGKFFGLSPFVQREIELALLHALIEHAPWIPGALWKGTTRILRPRSAFSASVDLLLTRGGAARRLGCAPAHVPLRLGAHERPLLAEGVQEIGFSIAHSGDCVLFALAPGRAVGIDVEALGARSDRMRIARRYFRPDEVARIEAEPAAERERSFLRFWTAKEALIKAAGGNLSAGLANFEVALGADDADALVATPPGVPSDWSLAPCAPRPGYLATWAAAGRPLHARRFDATGMSGIRASG